MRMLIRVIALVPLLSPLAFAQPAPSTAPSDDPIRAMAATVASQRGPVEARLAKIEDHESAKATILYPYDFARVIADGIRSYNAADLGIDQQNEPNYYNFGQGIRHSQQLLTQLEAGKDPLYQSTGDHERHYFNPEANEILPYRVRTPTGWDGKTPMPMVFILHGDTRNQDYYFDRDGQIIPKTADKHGFMLVGVFGYHPNGGYNSEMLNANRGGGRGGGRGRGFMNGMNPAKIGEMSEIDTMHVFDIVKKEYPIDPKQTFLFGYSHGGSGAYYIGEKYADNWAAIALGGAGNSPSDSYPYDKFKSLNIPFFIYCGDQDSAGVKNNEPRFVEAFKQHGIEAMFKMYPGVNHDGGPSAGVGDAFDFFAAHPRK
jgi:poly(3-hydroxybutyrate) depolymerase